MSPTALFNADNQDFIIHTTVSKLKKKKTIKNLHFLFNKYYVFGKCKSSSRRKPGIDFSHRLLFKNVLFVKNSIQRKIYFAINMIYKLTILDER